MRNVSKPTWYTDIHGEIIYEGDKVKLFNGSVHEVIWSEVQEDYCLKDLKPMSYIGGGVEIVQEMTTKGEKV